MVTQLVQITGNLAGRAAAVIVGLLKVVELFDDGEGNDDAAADKRKKRFGIVDQDVSVENKCLQAAYILAKGIRARGHSCPEIESPLSGAFV